ncbi:MAG: 4-hydroxythreonine-4-phosphate dehydrogenase PdxA [Deltaproteobacteria bacterium]|jgi:4-phospho-D-threonate 3-dehydrogenase / 4-phospho-D-erythronate 3-dehydrogenase|nr:4-hydroxythreonine-4-phosphate dehydrogenase PdxA [Deltaproteobacteria bacterium]
MSKPTLAITMGDPAGVGPEIIIKALHSSQHHSRFNLLILGEEDILSETASNLNISARIEAFNSFDEIQFNPECITVFNCQKLNRQAFKMSTPNSSSGEFTYQLIVKAVDMALKHEIDGIVTAPICKESLHMANHFFDGHTGLLAFLTDTQHYRMLFAAEKLKILHVTAHLPLLEACKIINIDMVYETIELGYHHMKRLGYQNPKIAVCGLNPHAGENGIFGREDIDNIQPAIEKAQNNGIMAEGPLPADTTFLLAYNGKFDMVIAQYHDQGHVPGKLVAFDTAVNVTVGLPIIRTSVDHGTAFDIAGKGIAKSDNLLFAIEYAYNMTKL